MSPIRLTQRKEPTQPPIPPAKDEPAIDAPAAARSDRSQCLISDRSLTPNQLLRRWGRSLELRFDHLEKRFRLIGQPWRHDVRLSDCTMAVVFKIAVEGRTEASPLDTLPSTVGFPTTTLERMCQGHVLPGEFHQGGDS